MNLDGDDEGYLSSVFQIWNVDKNDLNLLTPPASLPEGFLPKVASGSDENCKLCTSCNASNVYDANWCTECGVAFIEQSNTATLEEKATLCDETVVEKYGTTATIPCEVHCSCDEDVAGKYESTRIPHEHQLWEIAWRKPSRQTTSASCDDMLSKLEVSI